MNNSSDKSEKALAITAPLRYGGGSANMNNSAFNKQCAFRQVCASNPSQRKAAKRYVLWCNETHGKNLTIK